MTAIASTGCWGRVSGGPVASLNRGDVGAALNVELGYENRLLPTSHGVRVTTDVTTLFSTRAKFSPDASDFALAMGISKCWGGSRVGVCFLGGVDALQLGVVDRRVSFGMLGPFVEAPLVVRMTGRFGLTLGPGAQYDLRFTTRSEGFASVSLGLVLLPIDL